MRVLECSGGTQGRCRSHSTELGLGRAWLRPRPATPHPETWALTPCPSKVQQLLYREENNGNKTRLPPRAVMWTEVIHGKALCKQ